MGTIIFIFCAAFLFVTFTKIGRVFKVRAKGAAAEWIKKEASTADGAAAYYNAAIDRKMGFYRKAAQTDEKMLGKISGYEMQLESLQKENREIEASAEILIKRGSDEDARILLQKQSGNEEKIILLQDALTTLRESERVQSGNVKQLYQQIEGLKTEKEKAVMALEIAQTTGSLHPTAADSPEDEMLEAVREGVKLKQEQAAGRRIRFDTSPEAKQMKLTDLLKAERVEEKIRQLKEKARSKGANS